MITLHQLTAAATLLALCALIAYGSWKASWAATVWLGAAFTGDVLVLIAPEWWWTPAGWVVRDAIYASLRMLIALELIVVWFAPLPRLRRRAGLVMLCCLGVAAVYVSVAGQPTWLAVYRSLELSAGMTGILLLLLRGLAFRYDLPLHPVWDLLTFGLPVYLIAYAMTYGALFAPFAGRWAEFGVTAAWMTLALKLAAAARAGRAWLPPVLLMPSRYRLAAEGR
jgi:hypothetical protein